MPFDKHGDYYELPAPRGADRWWLVALLLAGPVVALVVWLLGG